MPAERILVFRLRSRSYLEGIFIPTNFFPEPHPVVTRRPIRTVVVFVASVARRLRPPLTPRLKSLPAVPKGLDKFPYLYYSRKYTLTDTALQRFALFSQSC